MILHFLFIEITTISSFLYFIFCFQKSKKESFISSFLKYEVIKKWFLLVKYKIPQRFYCFHFYYSSKNCNQFIFFNQQDFSLLSRSLQKIKEHNEYIIFIFTLQASRFYRDLNKVKLTIIVFARLSPFRGLFSLSII